MQILLSEVRARVHLTVHLLISTSVFGLKLERTRQSFVSTLTISPVSILLTLGNIMSDLLQNKIKVPSFLSHQPKALEVEERSIALQ